jgi:hypothetical protein
VPEDFPREGDEIIFAGIELHAHIVRENGNPKVIFTYLPTVQDRKLPEAMAKFNSMIEMVCSRTVAIFPEEGFARFYTVLKKSGESDRCWSGSGYPSGMMSMTGPMRRSRTGSIPNFSMRTPHVAHRGKKVKAMRWRLVKEFLSEMENLDEEEGE